jgi:hypothetical protein
MKEESWVLRVGDFSRYCGRVLLRPGQEGEAG